MLKPQLGYWEVTFEKYGRVKLPSGLLKLLPEDERKNFYCTPGFGRNILLWTEKAYLEQVEFIKSLDPNSPIVMKYRNVFLRGSGLAEKDSQDRLVISKRLIDYYGINKDAVIILADNRIEIWNLEVYNQEFAMDPNEFAKLNQQIHDEEYQKSGRRVSYDVS